MHIGEHPKCARHRRSATTCRSCTHFNGNSYNLHADVVVVVVYGRRRRSNSTCASTETARAYVVYYSIVYTIRCCEEVYINITWARARAECQARRHDPPRCSTTTTRHHTQPHSISFVLTVVAIGSSFLCASTTFWKLRTPLWVRSSPSLPSSCSYSTSNKWCVCALNARFFREILQPVPPRAVHDTFSVDFLFLLFANGCGVLFGSLCECVGEQLYVLVYVICVERAAENTVFMCGSHSHTKRLWSTWL